MKQDLESSFWKAAKKGNASRVRQLLAGLQSPEKRNLIRQLLLYSVMHGQAKVVEVLLAAGGNVEQVDCNGSLLKHAAWEGNLNVVRVLVAAGAVVDRKVEGKTALEAALENDHVEVADYLKRQGADWLMLTLLYACQRGDLAQVKKAIEAGAKIDRGYGAFKETPLMRAAGKGRIEVVRFLLAQGANPHARVDGKTALWVAAATGRSVEVINALVEAGADVNDQWDSVTALMAAAQFATLDVVKRLVDLGADVTAKDGTGVEGVLDYARKWKRTEILSYLTKLGARTARTPAHDLAREIARRFGGRPKSVWDGFAFNSKISGFKCQFRIGGPRCSVEVSNLELIDEDFRLGESAWLIIGAKPEPRRGPCRKVEEARQFTGAPVYRSTDKGSLRADSVFRFCRQHRRAFGRLRLSETDEVWIGDSFVQLTWAQSGQPKPWGRLNALGAFIREVARQSRPSSVEEWID